ncbi:hypothetical protein ACFWIO_22580 [Streptomyces diastatochromogenes]|uniref:hypothetical protein n=1 Tax=Streptomyces diastatochromogenes TaxID=42236 RepID=UPI00364B9A45
MPEVLLRPRGAHRFPKRHHLAVAGGVALVGTGVEVRGEPRVAEVRGGGHDAGQQVALVGAGRHEEVLGEPVGLHGAAVGAFGRRIQLVQPAGRDPASVGVAHAERVEQGDGLGPVGHGDQVQGGDRRAQGRTVESAQPAAVGGPGPVRLLMAQQGAFHRFAADRVERDGLLEQQGERGHLDAERRVGAVVGVRGRRCDPLGEGGPVRPLVAGDGGQRPGEVPQGPAEGGFPVRVGRRQRFERQDRCVGEQVPHVGVRFVQRLRPDAAFAGEQQEPYGALCGPGLP